MNNALLTVSKMTDASIRPGAKSGPAKINIPNAPSHTVARGVNQSTLGERRLRADFTDKMIALNGKTNTNPTNRLPMKYPMTGGLAGSNRAANATPNMIRAVASSRRGVTTGSLLAAAAKLLRRSSDDPKLGMGMLRTSTEVSWDTAK